MTAIQSALELLIAARCEELLRYPSWARLERDVLEAALALSIAYFGF